MKYGSNIKALENKYPGIGKLIDKAYKACDDNLILTEMESLDGTSGLKIVRDNKEYQMYGKRQAMLPILKWYKGLGELQNNSPIIIMGVANYEYLKILAEKTEKCLTILVYEPSIKIFVNFLHKVDISEWLNKHTLSFWVDGIDGMNNDGFRSLVASMLRYEVLPLSRTFVLPNYNEIFPEQTLFFVKTCHDIAFDESVNFVTKRRFSNVFAKNLFINMTMLCDAYKSTQLVNVVPRDTVGIVVAAGPSLNKNIKELKKAKGKAFIIAVDTAIKPLLKEGIVPDMFAIVDAKKPLDLIKVEGARNIPLSTTLDASSEILLYHTGKKFFANEGIKFVDNIFLKFENQYGSAADGGSVATSAFTLLYKIGLTTIILVGQDLALTGNKTHADGTFDEKMPELNTENCEMVEGNVEEFVPIRDDFKIYLNWYNNFISEAKNRDPKFRVINATEGGAKIKGTEVSTLKDAIEKECTKEINIQERFDKLNPMFEGEDRQWVVEQILSIPKQYANIALDAKKSLTLYKKLSSICSKSKLDTKAYVSTLKKINKCIKKIESYDLYQTISFTMNEAEYIIKNDQFIQYDSELEEGREIARQGMVFMNGVRECAEIYEEYATDVMGKWQEGKLQ